MEKEKLKEFGKNFALLLITVILFLFFLELTLRIFPWLFGQQIQNQLITKFHSGETGIYSYDSNIGMLLLKPGIETEVFRNGHYWIHKTDSKGFRNEKEINQADIILLGDSIIYGTGLNYKKTTAYFLQKETGLTVFNLSREGDCSFEQKFLLNKYAPELKPKHIFYFFFENDLYDLKIKLTKKEMNYFIQEQSIDDFSVKRKKITGTETANLYKKLVEYSFVARTIHILIHLKEDQIKLTNKIANKIIDTNGIEWQYTEKAIKQMKKFSDSINSEFILVPLTNEKNQQEKLKQIAEENGIPLIETEELIGYNQIPTIKKEYALERDWHLNEKGHEKLAEILLNYLKKNK